MIEIFKWPEWFAKPVRLGKQIYSQNIKTIGVLERFDQENLICFFILRASVLYRIECEADLFELMAEL